MITSPEIEQALKRVADNLVVQGELLNRLERHGEQQDERLGTLLTIAENHEGRLQVLQSAMTALFERLDRFIRGLESDGHKKKGKA